MSSAIGRAVANARTTSGRSGARGSDHAPFNQAGVPGFFWSETGVADYNYVHHTQHDNIAAAINAYLIQSSVAQAVTSYNLACADTMLPRAPQPAAAGGGGLQALIGPRS